jgi:hypothetical protein
MYVTVIVIHLTVMIIDATDVDNVDLCDEDDDDKCGDDHDHDNDG